MSFTVVCREMCFQCERRCFSKFMKRAGFFVRFRKNSIAKFIWITNIFSRDFFQTLGRSDLRVTPFSPVRRFSHSGPDAAEELLHVPHGRPVRHSRLWQPHLLRASHLGGHKNGAK